MIDHRELLRKYIAHVLVSEGETFISDMWLGDEFSAEERAELVTLNTQAVNAHPIAKLVLFVDEIQREYVRNQTLSPYLHEDDHKGR